MTPTGGAPAWAAAWPGATSPPRFRLSPTTRLTRLFSSRGCRVTNDNDGDITGYRRQSLLQPVFPRRAGSSPAVGVGQSLHDQLLLRRLRVVAGVGVWVEAAGQARRVAGDEMGDLRIVAADAVESANPAATHGAIGTKGGASIVVASWPGGDMFDFNYMESSGGYVSFQAGGVAYMRFGIFSSGTGAHAC